MKYSRVFMVLGQHAMDIKASHQWANRLDLDQEQAAVLAQHWDAACLQPALQGLSGEGSLTVCACHRMVDRLYCMWACSSGVMLAMAATLRRFSSDIASAYSASLSWPELGSMPKVAS